MQDKEGAKGGRPGDVVRKRIVHHGRRALWWAIEEGNSVLDGVHRLP